MQKNAIVTLLKLSLDGEDSTDKSVHLSNLTHQYESAVSILLENVSNLKKDFGNTFVPSNSSTSSVSASSHQTSDYKDLLLGSAKRQDRYILRTSTPKSSHANKVRHNRMLSCTLCILFRVIVIFYFYFILSSCQFIKIVLHTK